MKNKSAFYFSCPNCGTTLFFAHQSCHIDVICDGSGTYIDNANGLIGNDVYDATSCYGPFTCCTCGAEFDCEGNDFDIPNLEWTGAPTKVVNPFTYLDWELASETQMYFEVISRKFPYSMTFCKRDIHSGGLANMYLEKISCMNEKAIPIFPSKKRAMDVDNTYVVVSLDHQGHLFNHAEGPEKVREYIDLLAVAYETAVSMNLYIEHILQVFGKEEE